MIYIGYIIEMMNRDRFILIGGSDFIWGIDAGGPESNEKDGEEGSAGNNGLCSFSE